MSDPTETHRAIPTDLRIFRGKEFGGASDDIARAHDGHTCVVLDEVPDNPDDLRKFYVRFADDATCIAFEDELTRLEDA